ncbi:MAG: F0F1 ATP synthase subunit delta [bacterium]
MANNFDVAKILGIITEGEDPKTIERLAKKLVDKYPQKAAMLVRRLSLESEFRDSYITVTSAHELSEKQKALIKKIIEKKSLGDTEITYLINEDLLGGIIIRKGETIIDNSLRNRVEQLADFIKQTKFDVGLENAG